MDCENLKFSDNEFDAVYGRAILHHLNLHKGLCEIWRVLIQKEIAVFSEPLGMKPLINFYRMMTPGRRTPYEKPLGKVDFNLLSKAGFLILDIMNSPYFATWAFFLIVCLKFQKDQIQATSG